MINHQTANHQPTNHWLIVIHKIPGDSIRDLFLPDRWRSPATFEFGSRFHSPSQKVTNSIARSAEFSLTLRPLVITLPTQNNVTMNLGQILQPGGINCGNICEIEAPLKMLGQRSLKQFAKPLFMGTSTLSRFIQHLFDILCCDV